MSIEPSREDVRRMFAAMNAVIADIKPRRISHDTIPHRKYVEAGTWKCAESPTKAHHWIDQYGGVWKCKWCGAVKSMTCT